MEDNYEFLSESSMFFEDYYLNEESTPVSKDAEAHKKSLSQAQNKAAIAAGLGAMFLGPIGAGVGGRIAYKGSGRYAAAGSVVGTLLGSVTGNQRIAHLGNVVGAGLGGIYGAQQVHPEHVTRQDAIDHVAKHTQS